MKIHCLHSKKVFTCLSILLLLHLTAPAQVASFQKKVLDSLPAGSWLGNIGLGVNYNKSTIKKLFLTSSINTLYLSKLHSYNMRTSFYNNWSSGAVDDNWFYTFMSFDMLHHRTVDSFVRERKFNPEIFALFQYDRDRGITQRWQNGVNIVWNNSKLKHTRFNLGTGVFIENEKWRVFTKADYAIWDTLSPVLKELITDLLKMDDNQNIIRHNIRWNLYLNAYSSFGNNVSLNTFFSIQTPFKPPYKDLPPLPDFPTVTRIYPRYTIEALLFVKVTRVLSLTTRFYLQHDKGQIAPFTPDEVMNISQGFSLTF